MSGWRQLIITAQWRKMSRIPKSFLLFLNIDDHNVLFSLLLRHTSKTSNQKFK